MNYYLMTTLLLLGMLQTGCKKSDAKEISFAKVSQLSLNLLGTKLPAPRGLTLNDKGDLFIVDTSARISVYDQDNKLLRQWQMPEWKVGTPEDLLILSNGNLLVPDTHYHRVIVFNQHGKEQFRFGKFGKGDGEFIYPVSATEDKDGNLYICEYGQNNRVQKFNSKGEFILAFGGFGSGDNQFQRPAGIVWHKHKIYTADAVNNRILIHQDNGKYLGEIANSAETGIAMRLPYDIAIDNDETLWVIEYSGGKITHLSLAGKLLGCYGKVGRDSNDFCTPWGIACKKNKVVYVADTGNRRVVKLLRKVNPNHQ